MASTNSEEMFGVSEEQLSKSRKFRKMTDNVARLGISTGGIGVIVAICLIFFYLLYEVMPLFYPAQVEEQSQLADFNVEQPLYTVLEEQGQVGLSVDAKQGPLFFNARTGELIKAPGYPGSAAITTVARDAPGQRSYALGFDDGTVVIQQPNYRLDYSDGGKTVRPFIEYPNGETPIDVLPGTAIKHLVYRESDSNIRIIAGGSDGSLFVKDFSKTESFLSDEVELEELETLQLPRIYGTIDKILLSLDQRWLFLVKNKRQIEILDLRKSQEDMRIDVVDVVADGVQTTVVEFLLGGYSLLVGDDQGNVGQWFLSYNEDSEPYLANVRNLTFNEGVRTSRLDSEKFRGTGRLQCARPKTFRRGVLRASSPSLLEDVATIFAK